MVTVVNHRYGIGYGGVLEAKIWSKSSGVKFFAKCKKNILTLDLPLASSPPRCGPGGFLRKNVPATVRADPCKWRPQRIESICKTRQSKTVGGQPTTIP